MHRPSSPLPVVVVLRPLAGLGRRGAMALALCCGLLSALGFQPVGQLGPVVVGVGLLLLLLAAQPWRRAFLLGLSFGFGQFALGLSWIAEAFTFQSAMPAFMGWVAVLGLSLFLSLYPALAALAARRATRRIVPLAFSFAACFSVAEILRGLLFSGFAWNPLGVAFLQLPGVAQLAAIVGANGLSALAILAGGSLAALLAAHGQPGRWPLALLFPALVLFGVAIPRLQKPLPPPSGPELLLVQTGIGIDDKYAAGGELETLAKTIRETRAALAVGPPPAAVIWPEAAIEFPLEEEADLRREISHGLPAKTLLLTGGVSLVRDEAGRAIAATNSLYALDATGRILARYDKAHLVPGGEYLPLRAVAEPLGLARLVPGALDFRPGPGAETLSLPGLPPCSPVICYEIIFPAAVLDGARRPAFILTISNDAWFGRSGPPQHHAQARLRAIEEGLPVVRVTPTGLSGVIDARGAMPLLLPRGVAATARARLPAALAATPFARLGLLAPLAFAASLLLVGWRISQKT